MRISASIIIIACSLFSPAFAAEPVSYKVVARCMAVFEVVRKRSEVDGMIPESVRDLNNRMSAVFLALPIDVVEDAFEIEEQEEARLNSMLKASTSETSQAAATKALDRSVHSCMPLLSNQ